MADERNPNDPYRPNGESVPLTELERLIGQTEPQPQPDPEPSEDPASNGKVAAFAIAIAVVLGAVFYGLNN
jgi:hypothetical protein